MGFLNHQPYLVMPSTLVNPGTVITWGGENSGGDSRRVRHELIHVEQIYATHRAFAARLQDETVPWLPWFESAIQEGVIGKSPKMNV